MLRSGSGGKLPATKLPDTMMPNCLQKDREGCRRFSEQLQEIVEKKEKEPPMKLHPHVRHGQPKRAKTVKAAQAAIDNAVANSKRLSRKLSKTTGKINSPAPAHSLPATASQKDTAAPASKNAAPKEWADYGMKVWKPKKHAKKENLLSVKPVTK